MISPVRIKHQKESVLQLRFEDLPMRSFFIPVATKEEHGIVCLKVRGDMAITFLPGKGDQGHISTCSGNMMCKQVDVGINYALKEEKGGSHG